MSDQGSIPCQEITQDRTPKPSTAKRNQRKRKNEHQTKVTQNNSQENFMANCNIPNYSDFPINKDGYLYTLALPDPIAMGKTFNFQDYTNAANPIPIPSKFYRAYNFERVALSCSDKAAQLTLVNETEVIGSKGYSMIRCTHGISSNEYYFEVQILDLPQESAVRIGWSQKYASLQAPVGFDKFSYGWRSLLGTKFHQSIGKSYSEGYGVGDVVGIYICLPRNGIVLASSLKNHTLVKFKNKFYFEERYYSPNVSKELKVLNGSRIVFYKNGVSQGEAFKDIYQGTYFAAISIFKGARVKVNFGPTFQCAYPQSQPLSSRAEDEEVERYLANTLYLATDNI